MSNPDDSILEEDLGILRNHGRGGDNSNEPRGGSTSRSTGDVVDGVFIEPTEAFTIHAVVEQARRSIQDEVAFSVTNNQHVNDPPAFQARPYPEGEIINDDVSGNPQDPQAGDAQEIPVARYIGPYVPPPQDGQYPVAELVVYPQYAYPEAELIGIYEPWDQ
jgi:hypothetical protein